MTQILRSDQVLDEFDRPVPGAKIYIYNADGSDASITSDGTSQISQPLSTDEFGNYSYYADTNYYREDTWYGGKLRYRENNIALGNPGADLNLRSDLSASTGSSLINWIGAAVGSVVRSIRDKLRDQVHINDFSVVGNGTTDDSVGLNAFIASINANPGKRHVIDARTFATTTALTPITVSNAWLEGPGAHIHDVGTLVTGAVIKYIGTSAPTGKLLQLSAVSGASNQRLANARIKGIGLNCNGLIGTGFSLLSVRDSEIDLAIVNPTDRCVDANVVAALGEARDTQTNKITLRLRCIETPGGVGIVGGGDATANFSMNDLWVDAQYMNAPVYRGVNADSNIWHRFRVNKGGGGGTATEAVSLLGGATSTQSARDEKFPFYSADTPIHVYGTGSYTAGSLNHRITLDSGNGTPAPVIDAGASTVFEYDYTPTPEQPWATYTPTAVSTSGTITTLGTKLGEYRTMGRIVFYKAQIPITTNGTGALAVNVGLPAASAGTVGQTNAGIETALTSKGLTGYIAPGASVVTVRFSDGTYPGANGASLNISGWYET